MSGFDPRETVPWAPPRMPGHVTLPRHVGGQFRPRSRNGLRAAEPEFNNSTLTYGYKNDEGVFTPIGSGTVSGLPATVVGPAGSNYPVPAGSINADVQINAAIAAGATRIVIPTPLTVSSPVFLTSNLELYGLGMFRSTVGGGDIATEPNPIPFLKASSSWSGKAVVSTNPLAGPYGANNAVLRYNMNIHDLSVAPVAGGIGFDLSNADFSSFHHLYSNGGAYGFWMTYNDNTTHPNSIQVPGPRLIHDLWAGQSTTCGIHIDTQTQTVADRLYVNAAGGVGIQIWGYNSGLISNVFVQGHATTALDVNIRTFADATTAPTFGVLFSHILLYGKNSLDTGLNCNGIAPVVPVQFIGLGVGTNAIPTAGVTGVTIIGQV